MASTQRLALGALVTLSVACGGKSFEVDPGPGRGGSDRGGEGGFGNSGNTAGRAEGGSAGTARGGTGQGGGAGTACDGFQDGPEQRVEVVISNRSKSVLHLGARTFEGCTTTPPLFGVSDASGQVLSEPDSYCWQSCQSLIDSGPLGCPPICPLPSTLTLQPGESHYTTYSGRYSVQRKVPSECLPEYESGYQCQQQVAITPGAYEFWSVAGTALQCGGGGMGTAEVACPCELTPSGGCLNPGGVVLGDERKAVISVYLDASYGVYGTQQARPAPLPPSDVPGTGAANIVELIFSE